MTGILGAGTGGAGLNGTIGAVTPPPGGRGGGRAGVREPFAGRGIGGGALGFSKLSGVLLGNLGLVGEVNIGDKAPGVIPGERGPPRLG
jgi:hypothetical protein